MEKIKIKKYSKNFSYSKLSYYITKINYKLAISCCNTLMKINKLQHKQPLEY